jgi:hypothetical protein
MSNIGSTSGPPPGSMSVVTGPVTAEEMHFEAKVDLHFENSERASTHAFSAKVHGFEFSPDQVSDLRALFVGNIAALQQLADELHRSRVLLLTGERGLGKGTTALYIGDRLSSRPGAAMKPMRVVEPLDQDVRLDLRAVARDDDGFAGRATVFVDAFEQKNRSLFAFFSRTERIGWEQLIETLRRKDAYLLFTACRADVTVFRQRTAGQIVHYEVAPHAADILASGLARQLEHLRGLRPDREKRYEQMQKHAGEIVAALQTMNRIQRFVDEFSAGDAELSDALRRFTNIEEWFVTLAERDQQTWCAVLTLALAQLAPESAAIPWLDYERLRRAVAHRIATLGLTDAKGDDTPPPEEVRTLTDKDLIESCRAVIGKDPERLGDVVRFADRMYATEIWKTLLSHYRLVLTHLIPTFRTMAERERGTGRFSLRLLATQILGRIGEIDPARISLPLIRIWASSTDLTTRPLVGRLVQGVLASSNAVYRMAALQEIELLADPGQASDAAEAQDRLVTAIAAYAQIGPQAPEVTMTALGRIAVERLAPAIAHIHKVWRSAEEEAINAQGTGHRRIARYKQRRAAALAQVASELDEEQAAALFALEMAIVQLCVNTDPVTTLDSTRDWISKGKTETAVLVALLFVHGIAGELHGVIETPTGERLIASPLLSSLAASSEAVQTFSAFLSDLRNAITTQQTAFKLPAELQRGLEERLMALMVTWATDAADTPYRNAVVELFVTFALARNAARSREIYDLVGTRTFSGSDPLQSFARDVRKGLGL